MILSDRIATAPRVGYDSLFPVPSPGSEVKNDLEVGHHADDKTFVPNVVMVEAILPPGEVDEVLVKLMGAINSG